MIEKIKEFKYWRLVACIFAGILFTLNFVMIFDNYLWCDEIASIQIAKKPLLELISSTAMDVHPPLYYMILRLFGLILGFNGLTGHLVSIIPYGIILVVSLSIVWKKVGAFSSVILISLSSLLYSAVHFNIEIRMYSWASLFILLCFIYFREVLKAYASKDCILFVVFSLLAAYTHYFCIITVSVFYLAILIKAIRRHEKNILRRALAVWVSTIACYLPWAILFFINYKANEEKIYSARYNSIMPCLELMFESKFTWILFALFFVFVIIACFYQRKSTDGIWIISGVMAIAGTILVPFIISAVAAPIMEERHVYPSFIIAWLLLGYCISTCKHKNWYFICMLLLIVPFGISGIRYVQTEENNSEKAMEELLDSTVEIQKGGNGLVLSNEWQISVPILQYYYPNAVSGETIDEKDMVSTMVAKGEDSYWLMIKGEPTTDIMSDCENAGFGCEEVVNNGLIGGMRVWVYRVNR